MILEHKTATANLLIDGLGICNFNSRERRWEVGFMRHPEHELVLHVIHGFDPITIPPETKIVRVETVHGQTPDYEGGYPLGFFDNGPVSDRTRDEGSLTAREQENFRWAMNLDEGADVPQGQITLKPPPYLVTMVYISDAVFYAASLTPKNLFLVPLIANPNSIPATTLNRYLFGKTADQIGGDIRCAIDGAVEISIEEKKLPPLPHNPERPWEIRLMNMRPSMMHHDSMRADLRARETRNGDNLEQGDFQIYYDALEVTGEKYSLWGYQSQFRSGRTDCNMPWVGRSNLNGLISG